MTVTGLLLLSSLLAAPLVATDAAQPPLQPTQIQNGNFAAQTFDWQAPLELVTPQDSTELAGEAPAEERNQICYKIRLYIFKRDDDHAPEFAGSTTCGPRQPHAKNVAWPKARLVPAD